MILRSVNQAHGLFAFYDGLGLFRDTSSALVAVW